MQIVDSIGVRVTPELSRFRAELESELKKIDADLKMTVTVTKVDFKKANEQLRVWKQYAEAKLLQLNARVDSDALTQLTKKVVKIETTVIKRQVEGEANKAAQTFKDQFKNVLDKTGDLFSPLIKGANGLAGALTKLTGGATAILAIGGAASSAIGAIASLGSSLAAVRPAAYLAAGALGAGALAFLTFDKAWTGFQDALLTGEADALNELPATTRAAVLALIPLRKEFDLLNDSISEAIFKDLDKSFRGLEKQVIPPVKGAMVELGKSFNQTAKEAAGLLRSATSMEKFQTILGRSTVAASDITKTLPSLLSVLLDIGAAGSTVFAELTGGLDKASDGLAEFFRAQYESGALTNSIRQAVEVLKQFGTLIGNVFEIVGSVFSAARIEGADTLSILIRATDAMASFLKTGEGAAALKSLFTGLSTVFKSVASLLGSLGKEILTTLGPAIERLAPMIAEGIKALEPAVRPVVQAIAALGPVVGAVAVQIGTILATAFKFLGPTVEALAPAIADLATSFGTLLTGALQVVGPLVRGLANILSTLLQSALAALQPLLEKLIPVFTKVGEIVGSALAKMLPVFEQLGTTIGDNLAKAIEHLVPQIEPLAKSFTDMLVAVVPLLPELVRLATEIIPLLLENVARIIPHIISLFETITKVAPIFVDIASAITDNALPALDGLGSFLGDLASNVAGFVSGWVESFGGLIQFLAGIFTGDLQMAKEGIINIVSGMWEAIKSLFALGLQALLAPIAPFWDSFKQVMSAGGKQIGEWWDTFMDRLGNIIEGGWDGIIARAKSWIGDMINNVFGKGAADALFNAGKKLISALGDGIKAAFRGVLAVVSGGMSEIAGIFPHSPAKWGPFSGRGYTVYSGLALATDFGKGIAQGMPRAVQAAEEMMNQVAGTGITGGLDVDSASSLAVEIGASGGQIAEAVRTGLSEVQFVQDPSGQYRVVQQAGVSFNRR